MRARVLTFGIRAVTCRSLAFACLALAAACGGDEAAPVAAAPAESGTAAATTAAPPGTEAAADDGAEGSLRDRIRSEPAPPPPPSIWSSATTLAERVQNVEQALASGVSPIPLDIHDLGGWDFDERKEDPFPAHIRKLDGKEIVLRGFMLPDLDFENIRKFHLVRSLWGCCFGAPPGPNEIVRVTVSGDGIAYSYKTLEVRGTFRIAFELTDGLLDDLYRLEAAVVKEHAFDDPLAPKTVTPAERQKLKDFAGVEF